MSGFLRVKNWVKFQHYKGRNPPWIRLYNDLLEDYEFGCLQDASKWLAVGLWLLASRSENRIPNDPKWIGKKVNARTPVDLNALISAGFIETCDDASDVLAECKQNACLDLEVEGEVDLEARAVKKLRPSGSAKKRRGAAKGEVEIPPAWAPNATHRKLAGELAVDPDGEAVSFRDHAEAHGRKLRDWDAGFRTWLRKAKEFGRTGAKGDDLAGWGGMSDADVAKIQADLV